MSDFITLDLVEAKAKANLKAKIEAETRALKAFTTMLRALGTLELFEYDPAEIFGFAMIVAEEATKPGIRALARRRGSENLEGFVPREKKRTSETLQLISRGQPESALRTALEASGFRFAGTLDDTRFYVGVGDIADWLPFVCPHVQIQRVRMPEAGPAPAHIAQEQVLLRQEAQGDDPRAYLPATITPPAREKWFLHQATAEEADDLVRQAVIQEGPVSRENVIEAVRRGLQLGPIKANSRKALLDALDRLRQRGDVTIDESNLGVFYDVPGRPVIPRDRAKCLSHLHDASAFAPIEIRAALVKVLTAQNGLRENAAIDGAAAQLGITLRARRGKDPAALRIAGQLSQLIEAGDLVNSNGELFPNIPDLHTVEIKEMSSGNRNHAEDLLEAA